MSKTPSDADVSTPQLSELRLQLDTLDEELIRLLHRRADLALQVRDAKKRDALRVYAPEREREILERVAKRAAEGSFPSRQLEQIFLDILSATRSLVGELQVVYLGPRYSVADFAARAKFGEHVLYSAAHNESEVFARVERGDAGCGVLPISSSVSGLADRSFNLLIESNVEIIAEVEISEQVALFSRTSALGEIAVVYGLPTSFDQTRAWLAAHCPQAKRQVVDDVAELESRTLHEPGTALLALHELTKHSDLPLVASGLEEGTRGYARCVILGEKAPKSTGRDKTTIICAVSERAGALRDILRPFAELGVTLLRIESRPMRNRAGEFVFLIDLAGHREDESCAKAIEQLSELCSWVRIAGSYPLVCA